jgi:hypothetical protein
MSCVVYITVNIYIYIYIYIYIKLFKLTPMHLSIGEFKYLNNIFDSLKFLLILLLKKMCKSLVTGDILNGLDSF